MLSIKDNSVQQISENNTSIQRNMLGHYWSLRTRNSKAFPRSLFRIILETTISAWTFLVSNRLLFISSITLRSLFRTKLTTTDFRPDEQRAAMRRLQSSVGGMSKLITRYGSRRLMPWASRSVQIKILSDPERNSPMTASRSGCATLLCYPNLI